jgi:soluble cytochrome b562
MKQRMTDDELRALTDAEMRQAIGYWGGKLGMQRQKALVYYYGEPYLDLSPPEIEGRSSVVSPDVRNTIESMLPQLMVKFAGSDTVVEFEPIKPGDEMAAEQATDYVNYLYRVKNAGELKTYIWMKDALLSKCGILKVWWDTRNEETREAYYGLTKFELAQMLDDPEVEIIEQKTYPDEDDAKQRQDAIEQLTQQLQQAQQLAQQGNAPALQSVIQLQAQIAQIQQTPMAMLYDVDFRRVKSGGRVCVENVPPEEFLISRKAKDVQTAPFVGHRVERTISELRSMGYKDVDDLTSDDAAASLNMERIERLQYDDEYAYAPVESAEDMDEAQRKVWVTECYVRVDYDGDGIVELRKVVRAGNKILENEIVDGAPFVTIKPVPVPHKFFGLSVADLAMEGQKVKTSILRGMLDNMYLQVNGRYFAVEGQVNLDDLLTSRPGGIVRLKQPGMAGRLDQGMGDSQLGMSMMEYMTGYLEESTGWTRYNQGTDGDSLNDTATGVNIVTNRADMRLDLIARCFAEGFRDLFRMILKLVSQYQQKPAIVKLRGNWVPINPREWRNGFETTVNVGLGTGNKDQQVSHLMALLQQQQTGLQIGDATPQTVYQTHRELVKALGFKSPDKFFVDPGNAPAPNPAQGQMQLEQMKANVKAQADIQGQQARAQADAQIEAVRIQSAERMKQMEIALQERLAIVQQEAQQRQRALELQQEQALAEVKARWAYQTAIDIARINAGAKLGAAELQASQTPATLTPEQEQAANVSGIAPGSESA